MNATQILDDLDKHAFEFNFPVLDNEYVKFGAARVTAFQGTNHWLIVFEVLGFSTREIEFVDCLYGFGSCVPLEGIIGEEIPIRSSPRQPLFDAETNECLADWSRWSIRVGNEEMCFTPTREEYGAAGVIIDRDAGPGSLHEIELLRFLVHELGESRLFLNDQALLSHFPQCANLTKFLQATWWQHPDIGSGEKPSENPSIRSIVKALSLRDPSLFERGVPNTHWKCWPQAI